MSGTSDTPMMLVNADPPTREDVPRWRWLPSWWRWWPQKDSWWTSMRFSDGGVGFVVADSRDELGRLMAEQIRFYHDLPDSHGVGWWWSTAGNPAQPPSRAVSEPIDREGVEHG